MNQNLLKMVIDWQRRDYRAGRRLGVSFSTLEPQRVIIWALEKQIKVNAVMNFETGAAAVFYDCPVCGGVATAGADYYGQPNPTEYMYNHCLNCGKAIGWTWLDELRGMTE